MAFEGSRHRRGVLHRVSIPRRAQPMLSVLMVPTEFDAACVLAATLQGYPPNLFICLRPTEVRGNACGFLLPKKGTRSVESALFVGLFKYGVNSSRDYRINRS